MLFNEALKCHKKISFQNTENHVIFGFLHIVLCARLLVQIFFHVVFMCWKTPQKFDILILILFHNYRFCRLVLGHFNNHAFSHFPLNWNAVYIVLLVFMVASIREGNSTGSTICQKANSSQTASKTGQPSLIF